MRQLPEIFDGFYDGFSDYRSYLDYMSRDGSWGDALTLQAISHLLLRPILVVTDHPDSEQGLLVTEPPAVIDHDAWEAPFYIVHYGERHYEATRPSAKVKPEATVKRELK